MVKKAPASEVFYEVEEILQKRYVDGKPEYKVKWKGYPVSKSTWEPLENLEMTLDMVQDFEDEDRQVQKELEKEGRSKEKKQPVKKQGGTTTKLEAIKGVTSVREVDGDLEWTVELQNSNGTEIRSLNQLRTQAPQLLIDFLVSKLKFV